MDGTNRQGLIHRDIKPRNVMLTRAGAKLLDFNIASRVGDPVHTQSGTPPYQPPDAGLTRWDVSTDLFAVGVLLYQLLCNGNHPYPNAMPVVDGGLPTRERSAPTSALISRNSSSRHVLRPVVTASPRPPKCGLPCAISALTFSSQEPRRHPSQL